MAWLNELSLYGSYCHLVPLTHDHLNGLIDAVKDGELWKLWYTLIPEPDKMNAEIDRRLSLREKGSMLPFTVVCTKTKNIVGMTTFMNADNNDLRLEIGSTWYRKSAQRTGINTEIKLMLLTHAFETLSCIAVEFRTHFFNQNSRRGIERLGAKLDGILRNHMIMPDGTFRDTCVYSILSSEWPTVKQNLTWLATKPGTHKADNVF